MRFSSVIGLVLLSSSLAFADNLTISAENVAPSNDNGGHHDGDHHDGDHNCHPGQDCEKPRTRCAKFNLYCQYENGCTVTSTFEKQVTREGGEVADASDGKKGNTHPTLSVKCPSNPNPIYDQGAHRYTGSLQTRIQAETGPFPAIQLPRGELHTSGDHGGTHVSSSLLETAIGSYTNGTCYVWSGNP